MPSAKPTKRDNGQKWHDGIPALVRTLVGRSTRGLTDQEIADAVGATARTVRNWKKEHPEFLKAVLETKAVMDARVELSLFQRAIGYRATRVEVTIEGGQETKRVVKTEDVAPDVQACRLWLTNRDAANWRDVKNIEGRLDVRTFADLYEIAAHEGDATGPDPGNGPDDPAAEQG